MRRSEIGLGPLLFAAGNDGAYRFADARRRVVGVEVVEVGLDILRVIDIAMVTLAVIFPNQFPVGFDKIVHHLRHLRTIETLRPEQGRERFERLLERGRILRQ